MEFIKDILEYIATTHVLGFFPLDVIMHFVLGAIIFYFFLKVFGTQTFAYAGILLLAISKEIFDWEIMMRTQLYLEPVKDIVVTILGAYVAIPLGRKLNLSTKQFSKVQLWQLRLKLPLQDNNIQ